MDPAVLEGVRAVMGGDGLRSLLEKFRTQLDGDLASEPDREPDWNTIRSDAHKLVSTAGMLGFRQLSVLCGDLERACLATEHDGRSLAALLARATEEKTKVNAHVGDLLLGSPIASSSRA